MGDTGVATAAPGYDYFHAYKPQSFDDFKKNLSPGVDGTTGLKEKWTKQESYRSNHSYIRFKAGTDMGAIQYLFDNHPDHPLLQKGTGDIQVRRDVGGNDGLMFDNNGKIDNVAHNALYLGGSITNPASKAYKDAKQVAEGAAANNRNKTATVLAGSSGTKTSATQASPSGVQAASTPGSVLGDTDDAKGKALKSLLGG